MANFFSKKCEKEGEVVQLFLIFPVAMRGWLSEYRGFEQHLEEIRVRTGQPFQFLYGDRSYFLCKRGENFYFVKEKEPAVAEDGYRATGDMVREMLSYISRYSLYAYQEELREGFLTIAGGHRVGVAGQAVLSGGRVTGISPVTFLNIRIAHERKGSTKAVWRFIRERDTVYNTLILSAPGAGKTTMLRDLIRAVSDGELCGVCKKTGVVDERYEIAAADHGVPQTDLGPVTDVWSGCGKTDGIRMLLRSMSPEVLAVDELGNEADFAAVEEVVNCGCKVLATIHAGSMEELSERKGVQGWMEKGIFQRFLHLEKKKDGTRRMTVYDKTGRKIGETE